MWVPMALYGGVLSLVIWALPIAGWWNAAALISGWVAVIFAGSRLYASAEYVLTRDALTRRSRGTVETLPVASITTVYGHYDHAGDVLSISGETVGFSLQLGTDDVSGLLAALGPLLVELGRDQKVIEDERARRWLGLPGGGLRDPWIAPPSNT
ncbi:hypothetical protein JNB_09819 [Janibacter sp. HTCC2649]|nr:hypothetical protein JNB_09819 [Janibacter sp. HTCC2649]